jgi:DNA polymerase I
MNGNNKKRLVVIDGKSVFYRGYYAMPNLSTKDGTPTGGVYGFCVLALEVIKRLKPDYVCVAWDKPKTNIRKRLAIYPEYKAGRKAPPEDFYAQIPVLHKVLEALGWPLYEFDDYEADDIMATMARKADAQGLETLLVSSDLDLLQCISDTTHIYTLKNGLGNVDLYDTTAFETKYGIKVSQFADLKSLKGDSSDNIPGVPGIGEKTAADLLKTYGTIDEIYDNLALIKDSVARKLVAGKESAYMSREVVTLYFDAPIDLDLVNLDVANYDPQKLLQILTNLEFRSLIRQLPDLKDVHIAPIGAESSQKVGQSSLATKLPELIVVSKLSAVEQVRLESETIYMLSRSKEKHGCKPTWLALWDGLGPVFGFDLDQLDPEHVRSRLKDLLVGRKLIGYDLKSSFQLLLELGLDDLPAVEHDIHVGAFLINSLRRDLSLREIIMADYDSEVPDLDNIDDIELKSYTSYILKAIKEVANLQSEQISELTDVIKLADLVEWPTVRMLARVEKVGMKLDPDYLNTFNEQLTDKLSDVEQTIYGYADQEFNIASPAKLADILFTKLLLPTGNIKKGKTGYSTAAAELDKLRPLHPIIDCITEFRENTKLQNTYVEALPKQVDANNRIHSSLNLTVAQTGRLSSMDPNLQNIPVRTELGKHIRTAFVAEPGNVIISADYSQFELRIAAVLAGDLGMIEAFNNDVDIHAQTAADVNGVPLEQVTKEMRYAAKAVNFGILYGQGVFGLSAGTGMSMLESKEFIARYFAVRPKLREYIDSTKKQAHDKGYVATILGRRRPTPDVRSANFVVREAAYRAAVNMPIQGSAADFTKLAMVNVERYLDSYALENKVEGWKPVMIMQVHDSIMVECQAAQAEVISKQMKDIMEKVLPTLGVTLKVDVAIGTNWGEL